MVSASSIRPANNNSFSSNQSISSNMFGNVNSSFNLNHPVALFSGAKSLPHKK